MDCLFCQIACKKLASDILYEDDHVLVFHDIAPQAPVHFLVIPKKHTATLNDLSDEDTRLIGHMVKIGKNLANKHGLAESGYRLVMNTNTDGGQTVFHIHLHLLGGRPLQWPPG